MGETVRVKLLRKKGFFTLGKHQGGQWGEAGGQRESWERTPEKITGAGVGSGVEGAGHEDFICHGKESEFTLIKCHNLLCV